MRRTAEQGGSKFLLVVHPQRYQVQPADWEALRQRWNLRAEDFDLELADRRIAGMAAARGIQVCDLREDFAREAPNRPALPPRRRHALQPARASGRGRRSRGRC